MRYSLTGPTLTASSSYPEKGLVLRAAASAGRRGIPVAVTQHPGPVDPRDATIAVLKGEVERLADALDESAFEASYPTSETMKGSADHARALLRRLNLIDEGDDRC